MQVSPLLGKEEAAGGKGDEREREHLGQAVHMKEDMREEQRVRQG